MCLINVHGGVIQHSPAGAEVLQLNQKANTTSRLAVAVSVSSSLQSHALHILMT